MNRRARLLPLLAFAALTPACPSPTSPTDAGPDARTDATAFDTLADGPADSALDALADTAPPDAPIANCTRHGRAPGDVPPAWTGPSAAIEVYRDELGIPHMFAQNDEDLFFASGYMQAVDRLFEMDLMRRTAAGTLAEVVGPSALSQDETVRMVDIPRWGRESADRVRHDTPVSFRLAQAWVAGVNRRIAEITAGHTPLPVGFRATELAYAPTPWTVDDTFAVSRIILFRNANQLQYDLLATILRQYVPAAAPIALYQPMTDAFVLPPADRPSLGTGSMLPPPVNPAPTPLPADAIERLAEMSRALAPFQSGGSNNWAVAGRLTDNGRPLIMGDPHQPLRGPSVFWAQHMNSAAAGGTFDVVGFSFVGTPGVQLGHNRYVAWTATTTYPDIMDIFNVPTAGNAIMLAGTTHAVERCTEVINVKGQAPVNYLAEDVPGQGVLLPRTISPLPLTSGNNRMLFTWTGFRGTPEADMFIGFDRAHNVTEFEAAVDRGEVSAFNFVSADQHDISYRVHVLEPDRGAPATMPDPHQMLDGTDARAVWTGTWLDNARLPHSRGADRGWIASANNDPFGFTLNGRVDDDPWYYGVWFDPGTRAHRIEAELARLAAAGPITRTTMQTLQQDSYSEIADALLPVLATAVSHIDTDPALASYRGDAQLSALASQLAAWNRTMDRTSSAAVVFEGWAHFFERQVLADDLGATFASIIEAEPTYMLKFLSMTVNGRYPNADHLLQGGVDTLAMRALVDTRDWLTARFGGTDASRYHWSDFHRTRFDTWYPNATALDAGTISTNGAEGTVSVSDGQFFANGGPMANMFHEAAHGSVYRMVTGFADDGTPVSDVQFPPGNVGDPASPFWNNTASDWANGVYHTLRYERADVEAHTSEHITVAP